MFPGDTGSIWWKRGDGNMYVISTSGEIPHKSRWRWDKAEKPILSFLWLLSICTSGDPSPDSYRDLGDGNRNVISTSGEIPYKSRRRWNKSEKPILSFLWLLFIFTSGDPSFVWVTLTCTSSRRQEISPIIFPIRSPTLIAPNEKYKYTLKSGRGNRKKANKGQLCHGC